MLPLVAIFVWAGFCNALVRSHRRWARGLGGALTLVGGLVCFGALLHIV